MPSLVSALHSILALPAAYNLLQNLLGSKRGRCRFVNEYVRARKGDRILDIGCGTAEILAWLPDVHYYGFDSSQKYIEAATAKFGGRGSFRCEDVNSANLMGLPKFDIVLALGVLHHLDDGGAAKLLGLAKSALKNNGRVITVDPCLVGGQSKIARFIINRDRGKFVRNLEGYLALVRPVFPQVDHVIRHDLIRIPYTHLILECRS